MTRFQVFDVFTEAAFGGNQLAVIPDASNLAEADLQRIAREFNFSETTFVFPPVDPANDARVRIFTPTNEIPFAGHPTIGTAIALAGDTGRTDLKLELAVGPIACQVEIGTPSRAAFTTNVPLQYLSVIPVDTAAACLGLSPDQIVISNHAPQIASVGLPFTLVELTDDAAVSVASPFTEEFVKAEALYANNIDMFAIFLYVRTDNRINARMFAPLNNIPEDPATGSAAAATAAFLSNLEGSALDLTIDQGVDMGRPSSIEVKTTYAENQCKSVTVSGAAVQTMQGELVF